ncbi:MAG: AAA family ATPase [Betaproteobacteria bacterium]|nr:AAA family ATPase [Betaproteobacteria bacterium]
MLTALKIGNFKAFAETQTIALKPITLIFGPNSAGKSSFIHSLALAHEALRSGTLDVFRTDIGGSAIDLGGFRQYVHKTQRGRRVEWGAEIDTAYFAGPLAERLASVKRISLSLLIGLEGEEDEDGLLAELEGREPSQIYSGKEQEGAEARVVVMAYDLAADGTLLARMSRRRDGVLRLDQLNREHAVFRRVLEAIVLSNTTTDRVTDADLGALRVAVDRLVPEIRAKAERFLPEVLLPSGGSGTLAEALLRPVSRGARAADLAEAVSLFFPRAVAELINGVNDLVRKEMDMLTYLGPLRSFPPRHLAFALHEDRNWYAGGGYAWDVVRQDAEIRETINRWISAPALKTPYRLHVRSLFALDQMARPLANELGELVERLEVVRDAEFGHSAVIDDPEESARNMLKAIRASNVDRITELVLIDQRTKTIVSHRDVGIGISQVLPVLVMAYGSKGRIVAMEQPEIHLHPALQAELGDVFIEGALGERRNTFILETHSEHLILRLLRRIRETANGGLPAGAAPLKPDDLAVIYVQAEQAGSRVVQIPVTAEGDFAGRWPDGFFAERAKELF